MNVSDYIAVSCAIIAGISAFWAWKQYNANLTLSHLQNLIAERDKFESLCGLINSLKVNRDQLIKEYIDNDEFTKVYNKKVCERVSSLYSYKHYFNSEIQAQITHQLKLMEHAEQQYITAMDTEKFVDQFIHICSEKLYSLQLDIKKLQSKLKIK